MTTRSSPTSSVLPGVLGEAFAHGRPDSKAALVSAAGLRSFEAGQTILMQGDVSSLVLVLEGHVAVRRTTVDGRQLMVRIVTRGQLGTILPLAERPAVGDAVALTPSDAAIWRAEKVRSLANADPGLAVDILDHVLGSFEEVVERIDGLHHQDSLRRVARVLQQNADLFFREPPALTRRHLPILVGTSREMTGRVLRVLESRRLVVRVGRDRLRLLDPAGLARAADSGLDRAAIPRPAG
jgi:CRP-like cAMP-binding protein